VISDDLSTNVFNINVLVLCCSCHVFIVSLIMAACVTDGNIMFSLWFLLSSFFLSFFLFSSPNLSRRKLDVGHTCTHGVALVRI